MRIPVTIASWCRVPSAPRRLVGAISPTYIGVNPDASPAQRRRLIINSPVSHSFDPIRKALATVGANDEASEDHHLEGAAQLGKRHQTPPDEGKHVVDEHGFSPGNVQKCNMFGVSINKRTIWHFLSEI